MKDNKSDLDDEKNDRETEYGNSYDHNYDNGCDDEDNDYDYCYDHEDSNDYDNGWDHDDNNGYDNDGANNKDKVYLGFIPCLLQTTLFFIFPIYGHILHGLMDFCLFVFQKEQKLLKTDPSLRLKRIDPWLEPK